LERRLAVVLEAVLAEELVCMSAGGWVEVSATGSAGKLVGELARV
jgi:hypothetical protein